MARIELFHLFVEASRFATTSMIQLSKKLNLRSENS